IPLDYDTSFDKSYYTNFSLVSFLNPTSCYKKTLFVQQASCLLLILVPNIDSICYNYHLDIL
ncbi:MAG: hypothetical protein ACMG55_15230, partial [Microcoleus sp.]